MCWWSVRTGIAASTGLLTPVTVDHPAGDGYVVVGSADGQIRLYSERTLTRANTAIPGLGAPITAVDVTFDGKWVLATTATYLMVVLTTYKARAPCAAGAWCLGGCPCARCWPCGACEHRRTCLQLVCLVMCHSALNMPSCRPLQLADLPYKRMCILEEVKHCSAQLHGR